MLNLKIAKGIGLVTIEPGRENTFSWDFLLLASNSDLQPSYTFLCYVTDPQNT